MHFIDKSANREPSSCGREGIQNKCFTTTLTDSTFAHNLVREKTKTIWITKKFTGALKYG